MSDDTTKKLRGTIQVDEGQLQGHVDEVVRASVEETLNTRLEAEADQLCQAQRYERSPRPGRYAGRSLRPEAADQSGGRNAEGPQAPDAAIRDGDYRTVSPA